MKCTERLCAQKGYSPKVSELVRTRPQDFNLGTAPDWISTDLRGWGEEGPTRMHSYYPHTKVWIDNIGTSTYIYFSSSFCKTSVFACYKMYIIQATSQHYNCTLKHSIVCQLHFNKKFNDTKANIHVTQCMYSTPFTDRTLKTFEATALDYFPQGLWTTFSLRPALQLKTLTNQGKLLEARVGLFISVNPTSTQGLVLSRWSVLNLTVSWEPH